MALIVAKGSAEKFALLCKNMIEGRVTFERRGIVVTFEPCKINIIAPCVPRINHYLLTIIWDHVYAIHNEDDGQRIVAYSNHPERSYRDALFQLIMRQRMLPYIFYDFANRLPLADGALITAPKKFFDCETFDKYLMCGTFNNIHLVRPFVEENCYSACTKKREILIVDFKEINCEGCGRVLSSCLVAAVVRTVHDHVAVFCPACMRREYHTTIAYLIAKSYMIAQKSPFAHFLIEQERIGLRIVAAVSAFDMQKIYLIGNDYYASFMPPTPGIIARLLAGRKRLRFTKKINEAIIDCAISDENTLLLASEFGINAKLLFEARERESARLAEQIKTDESSPFLALARENFKAKKEGKSQKTEPMRCTRSDILGDSSDDEGESSDD